MLKIVISYHLSKQNFHPVRRESHMAKKTSGRKKKHTKKIKLTKALFNCKLRLWSVKT